MPMQPIIDPPLPLRCPGRRFQVWRYTVSHGQLLLRSNRDDRHATRCEILFKDVARMDLPTLIDDLEIDAAAEAEVPASVKELGVDEVRDRTIYRIRGRDCLGYVVAGALAYAEDDGEYHSPSSLLAGPCL